MGGLPTGFMGGGSLTRPRKASTIVGSTSIISFGTSPCASSIAVFEGAWQTPYGGGAFREPAV